MKQKRDREGLHLSGSNPNGEQYCGGSRDGFRTSKCRECLDLRLKPKKKCLRCEKEFTPGCGAKHVCKNCLYNRPNG